MTLHEEYLICQRRGHQEFKNEPGYGQGLMQGLLNQYNPGDWKTCKWCGTRYRTSTKPVYEEQNVPTAPIETYKLGVDFPG